MAKAACLWNDLLVHVAGCVRCVMQDERRMSLCRVGAEIHAEFEEEAHVERYQRHPDPAEAGFQRLVEEGKACVIRVSSVQMRAIESLDRNDIERWYLGVEGILGERALQLIAKRDVVDIQFEVWPSTPDPED